MLERITERIVAIAQRRKGMDLGGCINSLNPPYYSYGSQSKMLAASC